MAKRLVIAEENEVYCNRLKCYLEKHYKEEYEMAFFREKKDFLEYVSNQKCEIALFSTVFYDETIHLKNILLPIVLLEEDEEKPSIHKLKWTIPKYMRISKLMKYIKEQYEEVERNRPLIYSFYSPAGGVGQTTIAIGMALSYLNIGRKVLYINLEELDSTGLYFGKRSGSLSEHLPINELPSEVHFLAQYIKKDINTGILYWVKNEMETLEVNAMQEAIEKIIEYELANVIVLDLAHHYDLEKSSYFKIADSIVLVRNNQIQAKYKMKQMLEHKKLEDDLKDKLRLVINQGKKGDSVQEKIENPVIIEKVYAPNALGLCEYIAENKLLKLAGLE